MEEPSEKQPEEEDKEEDNNSEEDIEDPEEEKDEDEMDIYIKKPDGTVTNLLATPFHAGEVRQGASQEQDVHPQT